MKRLGGRLCNTGYGDKPLSVGSLLSDEAKKLARVKTTKREFVRDENARKVEEAESLAKRLSLKWWEKWSLHLLDTKEAFLGLAREALGLFEEESGVKLSKQKQERRREFNTKMGFMDPQAAARRTSERLKISGYDFGREKQGAMEEGLDEEAAEQHARDVTVRDKLEEASNIVGRPPTPEEVPRRNEVDRTKWTTRDFILESLTGSVAKSADGIRVDLLAKYPLYDVSRKAIQSSLKRLIEAGKVEKRGDQDLYIRINSVKVS